MAALTVAPAHAQEVTYRGFAEVRTKPYWQTVPGDDDRVEIEGRVRFEPAFRPANWLTLSGSVEARIDNQELVERRWRFDVRNRSLQRPALALRQLTATIRRGRVAVDVGKQFIRWGKADIFNPTDRFAPRDFLGVTDDEFLGVTGVRIQYEQGGHSLDVAWIPEFTPSRIPLVGRRWSPAVPQTFETTGVLELESAFPSRQQYGARWNLRASAVEFSLSYVDGVNHLPSFSATPLSGRPFVALQREYAPLRSAGADAAVPLPWFTLKGEMAWLTTTSSTVDDVVQYVIQMDRQSGEFSLVWGYAGEVVTARRSVFDFAPDRGLTSAFLGRASYTLGPTRDVAVEAAVRQDLDGLVVKGWLSQAVGTHWRWTLGATVIAGDEQDFLGQYHRNSHLVATLRYSF
jgi:hypothetical protein